MLTTLRQRAKQIKNRLPSHLYCLAFVYRRLLFRTTFIAITGSSGKTTAKNCLAGILSRQASTIATLGTRNTIRDDMLPRTILRVRPWHKYAIIEVGVGQVGAMKRSARLVKPDVCLVLRVGANHIKEFKNLEGVAAEKADLVRGLSPDKTVVLNGEDPLVLAMAAATRAKVYTFGGSARLEVWADNLRSRWPEPFAFDLHSGSATYSVRTRFHGKHWINSVLGAIAAAHACGIPLPAALSPIEETEPYWARMQPIRLPNGAVIIRDDWSGSIDGFAAAFDMLAEAQADRKIVVIASNMTDTTLRHKARANFLAKHAARAAQVAVFVGEDAQRVKSQALACGLPEGCVHAFETWQSAAELLKREMRAGDLVLVKGRSCDHLGRVYLDLVGRVACRDPYCNKTTLCDHCRALGIKWAPELEGYIAPPLRD
jgi:UDP-N-acetylmuramoyl-tripeptide--D-alanyl-D-alanine ligase